MFLITWSLKHDLWFNILAMAGCLLPCCVFADIWMVVCWMQSVDHTFSSLTHLMLTMCRLAECWEMNSYLVCRWLLLHYHLLSCAWLYDTVFTVRSTLIWALLTDPTDSVCHAGKLTPCIEAVAWSCIIVTWWIGSGGIQAWSRLLPGLLVSEMTSNVLSGTLSNQPITR